MKLDSFSEKLTLAIGGICVAVWLINLPKIYSPVFAAPWRGALYYLKASPRDLAEMKPGTSPPRPPPSPLRRRKGCGRARRGGHPRGAPRGDHALPLARHPPHGRPQRHRPQAALRRDARLHHRHLHRQDGHPHHQPDDRRRARHGAAKGGAGRRRAARVPRRRRLLRAAGPRCRPRGGDATRQGRGAARADVRPVQRRGDHLLGRAVRPGGRADRGGPQGTAPPELCTTRHSPPPRRRPSPRLPRLSRCSPRRLACTAPPARPTPPPPRRTTARCSTRGTSGRRRSSFRARASRCRCSAGRSARGSTVSSSRNLPGTF